MKSEHGPQLIRPLPVANNSHQLAVPLFVPAPMPALHRAISSRQPAQLMTQLQLLSAKPWDQAIYELYQNHLFGQHWREPLAFAISLQAWPLVNILDKYSIQKGGTNGPALYSAHLRIVAASIEAGNRNHVTSFIEAVQSFTEPEQAQLDSRVVCYYLNKLLAKAIQYNQQEIFFDLVNAIGQARVRVFSHRAADGKQALDYALEQAQNAKLCYLQYILANPSCLEPNQRIYLVPAYEILMQQYNIARTQNDHDLIQECLETIKRLASLGVHAGRYAGSNTAFERILLHHPHDNALVKAMMFHPEAKQDSAFYQVVMLLLCRAERDNDRDAILFIASAGYATPSLIKRAFVDNDLQLIQVLASNAKRYKASLLDVFSQKEAEFLCGQARVGQWQCVITYLEHLPVKSDVRLHLLDELLRTAASTQASESVIEALLNRGACTGKAQVGKNTPISIAVKNNDWATVTAIAKHSHSRHQQHYFSAALRAAAKANNTAAVKALAKKASNVNYSGGKYGHTPLHEAVLNSSAEQVRVLIENGANQRAQDKIGDTPTSLLQYMRGLQPHPEHDRIAGLLGVAKLPPVSVSFHATPALQQSSASKSVKEPRLNRRREVVIQQVLQNNQPQAFQKLDALIHQLQSFSVANDQTHRHAAVSAFKETALTYYDAIRSDDSLVIDRVCDELKAKKQAFGALDTAAQELLKRTEGLSEGELAEATRINIQAAIKNAYFMYSIDMTSAKQSAQQLCAHLEGLRNSLQKNPLKAVTVQSPALSAGLFAQDDRTRAIDSVDKALNESGFSFTK